MSRNSRYETRLVAAAILLLGGQAALASQLGVHYATVSRYENGKSKLPMLVRQKLEALLSEAGLSLGV